MTILIPNSGYELFAVVIAWLARQRLELGPIGALYPALTGKIHLAGIEPQLLHHIIDHCINAGHQSGRSGQRPVEVESAFGNLKRNMGFTRFMLRGIDKVAIETGLLATAMNLRKLAAAMAQQAGKAANEVLYRLEERL